MWFGSIRSWQIVREKVETVTDFIFLGSKITVDGYCRNTFKRCLLLGRKADKPRQHIKKQSHHFVDKSPLVKVIPVVISVVNGCVDWSIKKGWVLKNWWFQIVMLEKRVKSLGLQQEQSSQSWRKLVLNVHWNIHCWVHCWSWNSNTSATWCLEPSHWKRPWCWEG